MYFEDLNAVLAMGKHGVYVWSAYGASFLLIAGLVLQIRVRRKTVVAEIRRAIRRENDSSSDRA